MTLSKQSIEMMIDLVENKLSCMEVWDREDRREADTLQRCLAELRALAGAQEASPESTGLTDKLTGPIHRRGRRPKGPPVHAL